MDLNQALIRLDEGQKPLPYQDSDGIWTIADGHNLQANGLPPGICSDAPEGMAYPECLDFLVSRGGLTSAEIQALYQYDLKADCGWLWAKPWWASVNQARQAALNDMAFNLGQEKAQAFTTFYGLVAIGDWAAAADDLEFKTEVAKELPTRYDRLAQILSTGSAAAFIPGAP